MRGKTVARGLPPEIERPVPPYPPPPLHDGASAAGTPGFFSILQEWIGQRVLVTLDDWITGPDGLTYRAVFGTLRAVVTDEQALGFRTRGHSAGWFAAVDTVLIAGCKIHYAQRCADIHRGSVSDYSVSGADVVRYERPTHILEPAAFPASSGPEAAAQTEGAT